MSKGPKSFARLLPANKDIQLDDLTAVRISPVERKIAGLKDGQSVTLGFADFGNDNDLEKRHFTVTYIATHRKYGSCYRVEDGAAGKPSIDGTYYSRDIRIRPGAQHEVKIHRPVHLKPGNYILAGDRSLELPVNFNEYDPYVLAHSPVIFANEAIKLFPSENQTITREAPYGSYLIHVDRGAGARKVNQDGALAYLSPRGLLTLGVLDGIGGAPARKSEEAVANIIGSMQRSLFERDSLSKAIYEAGRDLERFASYPQSSKNMAACFTGVQISRNECVFTWLGDCKGVLIPSRSNPIQKIYETEDHSVAPGSCEVTKCIAVAGGEFLKMEPSISRRKKLSSGDWVVVASDGLWKVIDPELLRKILHKYDEPYAAMKAINRLVKRMAFQTPKDDNLGVALYKHLI